MTKMTAIGISRAAWAGSLGLALALGALGWTAAQEGAASPDPLQQQLEEQRAVGERQQAALAEIRSALASLSDEEQATLRQLDTLNTKIDTLRGQASSLEVKLKGAEARLGVTGRDILALQTRVESLRQSVALNMGALYRERTGEYLALLAQAQTLPELLLRLRWANYAGERYVATIQELDAETARLQDEQATEEQTRAELQTLQAERRKALDDLAARQAEAQTLLAGLRQSAEGQRLLDLQGQAELQQTGENITQLMDAAVSRQQAQEAQRQRDLQAQRQREAESAARLREAEAARERLAAAPAPARANAVNAPAKSKAAPTPAAPQTARNSAGAKANPSTGTGADDEAATVTATQPEAATPAPTSAAKSAPASASSPAPAPTPAAAAPPAESPAPIPTPTPAPAPVTAPDLPTPQQLSEARTQAETSVQLTEAQLAPLRGSLEALQFPLPGGFVSEGYSAESPWAVIRGSGTAQASAEGVVMAVTSFSSLGWVVLLDHGNNLITAYLGLNEPTVAVGERLAQGAPLGTIGGSPVFGPDAMAFQVNRVDGAQRTPLPPPF